MDYFSNEQVFRLKTFKNEQERTKTSKIMVNLSSRFAKYFRSRGETRYAFAKRVGISPSTIDNYLQGDRVPNADVLTKLFASDPRLSPLWFFSDDETLPMYLDEEKPVEGTLTDEVSLARLRALEEENQNLKEQLKDKDKIIKMLLDKVN